MTSSGPRQAGDRLYFAALMAGTSVFALGESAVNVLLPPHLQHQGLSEPRIGPVVAGFSVAALIMRFVTGSVYRPQRVVWLLPLGCVTSAVAFLGLSVVVRPWLLGALVALNGAGFAITSTTGLSAIIDASGGRSSSLVMGWYTGALGVGHAAAAVLGGALGDALGTGPAISVMATVPLSAAVALAVVLYRGRRALTADVAVERAGQPRRFVEQFRSVGPLVWLAFAVALHINLLGGVLSTYFPLYGLTIGLSLTHIGALSGLHSGLSTLVRFASPVLLRRSEPRRALPWLVVSGGLGVAALSVSTTFGALAVAWSVIGLSRGVLRVSSAALVMDSSGARGRQQGASSGVYLAGLDAGRIIGPLMGGVAVDAWGYPAAFLLAGLGFPPVYLILSAHLRRRDRRASARASSEATTRRGH